MDLVTRIDLFLLILKLFDSSKQNRIWNIKQIYVIFLAIDLPEIFIYLYVLDNKLCCTYIAKFFR